MTLAHCSLYASYSTSCTASTYRLLQRNEAVITLSGSG